MQSFSTTETRHLFEIDGVEYFLPGLTIDDYEAVSEVMVVPDHQRPPAFRDFILERASEDAAEALRKLTIKQTSQLFREWVGLTGKSEIAPGESSGSAV